MCVIKDRCFFKISADEDTREFQLDLQGARVHHFTVCIFLSEPF